MEELEADVLVAGGGMAGPHGGCSGAGSWRACRPGRRRPPGRRCGWPVLATALGDAPEDQPEALFNDMFVAGGFVSNPALLAAIVERIGPETRFLQGLGVPFRMVDGKLARRQAAGVSWPRAVYSMDMVGAEARKLLLGRLKPSATVVAGGFLVDLDVHDGAVCGGLVALQDGAAWIHVAAPAVRTGERRGRLAV